MEVEREQHFLINCEILKKEIKEAELNGKDRVIEIGAGKGILTEKLAKQSGKVLAFEIDKKFVKELGRLEKYANLKIIYKNALAYEWEGYNKIVSNIPYSLSEAVIWKAINSNIETLVLIISESFKKNLVSEDKKIGLIAKLFFNIKELCVVKKENFSPQPKTDSWLVKLERKKGLTDEEKIMQKIVTKNSKLKNAIIYSLAEKGKTKREAKEILKNLGLYERVLNKPSKKITAKLIKIIGEKLEES